MGSANILSRNPWVYYRLAPEAIADVAKAVAGLSGR